MSNLTLVEATARAALLRVERYQVELDFTGARAGGTFGSTTVVRFGCTEPGGSTFVDLAADTVLQVELNGRPIDPAEVSGERLTLVDLADTNELRVRALMPYSDAAEGIHHFVDPEDGETYVYAQAGPAFAGNIFACFDQPDLKAPIQLNVIVPPEWTVRANGAGRQPSPGRWEFTETRPISTYLMTVVAGPWYALADEHDGIPLELLCRRSLRPVLDEQAAEIFDLTKVCFDRYHELFELRYPFGQYGQVFVPEFTWGAVENPGCVTFREELLFRSAVTETDRERRAVIIAHEMAHMWFGDLVTLRWWDDIWLNESFAEYLGWRVTAEATRYTAAWTDFAVWRKRTGIIADQRPSTHPVAPTAVADVAEGRLNFDGISYAKGASVLRQLVVWLGDEPFLRGLRAFFAAHAFGNATLADLLDALAAASGRDLTDWADVWLRRPQVNTLRPDVFVGEDGRYSEVVVDQSAVPQYPTLRPHHIRVGVYGDGGHHQHAELDLDPSVDNGRTTVAGLTGQPAGRIVVVNDGDLTFAKIRLDPASLAAVPTVLPTVDDPLARALIWGALTDATRDAGLPPARFLELATDALATEPHVTLFEEVLRFARTQVADRFLDPAQRPAALTALAGTCAKVLAGPADDGRRDARIAAAYGFVRCAGPDDAPTLDGWLAGQDLPAGVSLDPALRWAIRYRLTVLGLGGEAEIEAEVRLDPGAEGVEHGARCRAAIADPAAKERAWALALGDEVSGRISSATAEGFWQPEQAGLIESYVDRYFVELPALDAARSANRLQAAALNLFPRYAVSPDTLAGAEAMLARADLDPVLRRVADDATDDLRRALAARG